MKAFGEEKYTSYSFLKSTLDEVGQRHYTAALYPQERTPGTHGIGGSEGHRWPQSQFGYRGFAFASAGIEPQPPGRQVRSKERVTSIFTLIFRIEVEAIRSTETAITHKTTHGHNSEDHDRHWLVGLIRSELVRSSLALSGSVWSCLF
jgi:hypothetical protein